MLYWDNENDNGIMLQWDNIYIYYSRGTGVISLILVLGEWDDGYSYGIMLLVMAWFEGKNGTGRNALYFLGKPMASCRCFLQSREVNHGWYRIG